MNSRQGVCQIPPCLPSSLQQLHLRGSSLALPAPHCLIARQAYWLIVTQKLSEQTLYGIICVPHDAVSWASISMWILPFSAVLVFGVYSLRNVHQRMKRQRKSESSHWSAKIPLNVPAGPSLLRYTPS